MENGKLIFTIEPEIKRKICSWYEPAEFFDQYKNQLLSEIRDYINSDKPFIDFSSIMKISSMVIYIKDDHTFTMDLISDYDIEDQVVEAFIEQVYETCSRSKISEDEKYEYSLFYRQNDPAIFLNFERFQEDPSKTSFFFIMQNKLFIESPFGYKFHFKTTDLRYPFTIWAYNLYSLYNGINAIITSNDDKNMIKEDND